jgi:hypothetical protein
MCWSLEPGCFRRGKVEKGRQKESEYFCEEQEKLEHGFHSKKEIHARNQNPSLLTGDEVRRCRIVGDSTHDGADGRFVCGSASEGKLAEGLAVPFWFV